MSGKGQAGSGLLPVTVVVVVWNTADLAIRTLESLTGGYAEGLRVVLVDNGSVDGSAAAIQRFLDGWPYAASVTFLCSPENLGFTGGVNLGTDAALAAEPSPDYVWMLNPDAVVTPETIREMVAIARESGAGIVTAGGGGRQGAIWPRTFWWPPLRKRKAPATERWCRADCYRGSCAIFEASLVRALIQKDGQFQEDSLFMYWDERDTTLRAKRLGGVVVFARDAHVEHSGGETRGSSNVAAARQYYLARNSIAVAKRHLPGWQFWWMLPFHLVRDLVWLARLRIQRQGPKEKAYLLGAIDGLRGRSGRWKHHPPSPAAKA